MLSHRSAILEVRYGPLACRKLIIPPNLAVRVGRTDAADFEIPGDPDLSRVHFELSWDGGVCTIRDLKSLTGTMLNGIRVDHAEVTHGSWIRAGETDFSLYIEGYTLPTHTRIAHPDAEHSHQKWECSLPVLEAEASQGGLMALLDASRDDRVLELLHESVEQYQSLYDGVRGETMADAAPYLVQLPNGSALLRRLVQEGWGKAWGVYFRCAGAHKMVRRHFRRLLFVESESGDRLYFRFYDPRVLRVFLPTCTVQQCATLFGEVSVFWMESSGGEIVRFDSTSISPGATKR